jgi:hypothetical protein
MMQSQQEAEEQNPAMVQLLQRVRNKPFFDWYNRDHKQIQILDANATIERKPKCGCFNCVIGWPRKGNKIYPLFDYELQIFRALTEPTFINSRKATEEDDRWYVEQQRLVEKMTTVKRGSIINSRTKLLKERQDRLSYPSKYKHLAVLKSSGLGISELALRFLLWLAVRNDDLKGSQIVIFTGPRLELAVSLVGRIKGLMMKNHDITFSDKETVLNINGVHVEAFPSHHADSARGLPNVSAVLVDESAFIPDREIDNVMDICIRNIPKSDPYLICISTPNKPGDFMDRLFQEDYETSIWKRLALSYTWGIGKIYDLDFINHVKGTISFEREFNLKFSGLSGNVLSPTAIDRCISTGETLAKTAPLDDWSIPTKYVLSIDIGWGSSATAVMVSRFISGKVQIIYSKEFNRSVFQDIINTIWQLKTKCNGNLQNILMDASATELYTTLCNEFNQNPSQVYLRDKQNWCKSVNTYLENHLFVVPIAFNSPTGGKYMLNHTQTPTGGKYMLNHTQRMIEETEDNGTAMVGIHPSFEDLITSMRSAYAVEDKLDKERTVFADTFDALRINLSWYRWSK